MTSLLAVTGTGLVRFRVEGGGGSTEPVLRDPAVRAALVHPHDRRHIVTGARGHRLRRSEDAGATWTPLELPAADVFSVAASAADGSLWAGTEPSRLFRSRDRGRSWDERTALQDVPSRERWSYPPRPWTSHVRSIAPHPEDAELVLVGIELGGVMRTEDGGSSFADHPPGAVADVHALAWHPHATNRAYEAGGGGAAWSDDFGRSWSPHDHGRDLDYCWGLAVDPEDPELWFVSAAASARRAHSGSDAGAAVYRSESGRAWEPVGEGLPSPLASFPYALAFFGDRLWVGLGDGRIFRSSDRGDRFEEIEMAPGDRELLTGLKHLIPEPRAGHE